jgi:hypothetical protein
MAVAHLLAERKVCVSALAVEQMKIFLSQNEIARRVGLPLPTLKARLDELGVEPDGMIVNGGKVPGIIFESGRLEQLRQALTMPAAQIR